MKTLSQAMASQSTIAIAVDITKAFDAVSHRLLIEMIHRSRLRDNLVIVAYLRSMNASCFYQRPVSPSRKVRAGVPQKFVISPALLNHFVSNCSLTDCDLTLLGSTSSIVESEARANQIRVGVLPLERTPTPWPGAFYEPRRLGNLS